VAHVFCRPHVLPVTQPMGNHTAPSRIKCTYCTYVMEKNIQYAYVKMQLQLWKNFLVSPITKSTIVHIYEMRYSLLKLDAVLCCCTPPPIEKSWLCHEMWSTYGLSGKKMRWHFSKQRREWSDGCAMLRLKTEFQVRS